MANKFWTTEEDNFLEDNYDELGVAKCMRLMGRSYDSVYKRAMRLGLIPTKEGIKRKLQNKNLSRVQYKIDPLMVEVLSKPWLPGSFYSNMPTEIESDA